MHLSVRVLGFFCRSLLNHGSFIDLCAPTKKLYDHLNNFCTPVYGKPYDPLYNHCTAVHRELYYWGQMKGSDEKDIGMKRSGVFVYRISTVSLCTQFCALFASNLLFCVVCLIRLMLSI